ncbi:MAG: hypothetical protein RL141_54 [Candidatus Parcubacteria bacterium]|jgi:hypothetical protein
MQTFIVIVEDSSEKGAVKYTYHIRGGRIIRFYEGTHQTGMIPISWEAQFCQEITSIRFDQLVLGDETGDGREVLSVSEILLEEVPSRLSQLNTVIEIVLCAGDEIRASQFVLFARKADPGSREASESTKATVPPPSFHPDPAVEEAAPLVEEDEADPIPLSRPPVSPNVARPRITLKPPPEGYAAPAPSDGKARQTPIQEAVRQCADNRSADAVSNGEPKAVSGGLPPPPSESMEIEVVRPPPASPVPTSLPGLAWTNQRLELEDDPSKTTPAAPPSAIPTPESLGFRKFSRGR